MTKQSKRWTWWAFVSAFLFLAVDIDRMLRADFNLDWAKTTMTVGAVCLVLGFGIGNLIHRKKT